MQALQTGSATACVLCACPLLGLAYALAEHWRQYLSWLAFGSMCVLQELEAAHAREADLEQGLREAQSGLKELEGCAREAAALQKQVAALTAELQVRLLLTGTSDA